MTFANTKQNKPRPKAPQKASGTASAEPAFTLPPGVVPGKEAILAGAVEQIALDKIDIIDKRDRGAMTDAELKIEELAHSIATVGLQQPIHVIPHNAGRYALVFGERRVRACRLLKHQRIAAVVVPQASTPAQTDTVASEARAVENIQRVDPSPIGEAVAIADLFDIKMAERLKLEGGDPTACVSIMAKIRSEVIASVADRVGKPIAWVRDRMFLAGFSGAARELVASGRLPLAHAREIAKVADPKRRDELAEEFAAGPAGSKNELQHGEGRPGDIERLRHEVAKSMWSLAQVPWDQAVPFDGKPACEECPHNSKNNPGLFDGKALFADDPKGANKFGRYGAPSERPEPKSGICLQPQCYREKTAACSRALSGAVTKVLNKYEPAHAAKQKGADALLRLPAIREVTPPFVSAFAVRERVEARLETRKKPNAKGTSDAGKKRSGPRPGEYGTPEWKARYDGEHRFREAEQHWEDKIANPALAKYLSEKEGRWAMFALVQRSKPYEKSCHCNSKPKDWQSPQLQRLLKLVESPSFENMLEIQRECGTAFGLFAPPYLSRITMGFQVEVLKAFGVAIAPPPVEEDFIKAELAKLKKPEAKDGKKPPAKKGPTKKHAEAERDDEEADE